MKTIEKAQNDIQILIANIRALEELTGEKLEDEDAIIVDEIEEEWAAQDAGEGV